MVGYQQGLMNIADEDLISNGYKNYGFYAKVGTSNQGGPYASVFILIFTSQYLQLWMNVWQN